MFMSLIRSMFSGVVSNMQDDAVGQPQQSLRPGARVFLGVFWAVVLLVSVAMSLAIRVWNRVEMFFEMTQGA
ncbi:MAG: hypothetical protein IPJ82_20610 [Lewinellaceae bacterium]|nr:hypothetical protein [Lewinellaceae bacterium]